MGYKLHYRSDLLENIIPEEDFKNILRKANKIMENVWMSKKIHDKVVIYIIY